MSSSSSLKRFWAFLKEDTWQSWLVSLVLVFVLIKFVFFPLLSLATATPLPLVVVESCSMYHEVGFDSWWEQNQAWYLSHGINRSEFENFPFTNGLNKGDIVFVSGRRAPQLGDIIIFTSSYQYPIIHRIIDTDVLQTKGDHNPGQLSAELNIADDAVLGHAVARIPALGWIKLVFFEGFKSPEQRGFCS